MVAGRTRIRNRSWGHLFESCEFEVPQRCGGVEQYLIGQRFGFETRDRLVQGEYAVLESDEGRIHCIVGHWPFHDIEIVEEIRCSVGYDEPQPFGVRFLESPDLQFLGCFEPVVLIYVEDGRTIVPSFEYLGGLSAGLFPWRRSCRIPRRSPKDGRVCGFQVYQQPCCFHDRESQDMPPDFP